MAELRHATRAYLAEGHHPATVVDQLNRLLLELIPDEMATLCLLDIEPGTGTARLANAGHPPPLLVTAGRAEFLTHHTPLLGMPGPSATEVTFTLEPGGVLVLFTDGLVERRGRGVDEGLAVLAEVGPPTPEDDIAIVVLRRT
jgi:serine phosphatase RsbU (regulator of sigma subunit)